MKSKIDNLFNKLDLQSTNKGNVYSGKGLKKQQEFGNKNEKQSEVSGYDGREIQKKFRESDPFLLNYRRS